MFTRIPTEPEKFKAFIDRTDDLQSTIDERGYTINPRKPDGTTDFQNKEGIVEVKNKPHYYKWDWTEEESASWTEYRKNFDSLYEQYSNQGSNDVVKAQIEKAIQNFIEYDHEKGLVERVAVSVWTPQAHYEVFNIRQNVMEIKTPLRTIRIKYEKAIPLSADEKELMDTYVALHERTVELKSAAKELQKKMKPLAKRLLDPLWEKYPVLREKSDKVQNRVFIPPPTMKGAPSAVVQIYIPTAEEAQKAADDFNEYSSRFVEQVNATHHEIVELEGEFKWAGDYSNEEEVDTNAMFDKIDELTSLDFEKGVAGSLETMSFEDDKETFLESWSKVMDEVQKAWDDWCAFVENYNLLTSVYQNYVNYANGTMDTDDEEEDDDDTGGFNLDDLLKQSPKSEEPAEDEDDPRVETINRYKADLEKKTNTYFDTQDWHVIMDHYQKLFDHKNIELAMKRALEQHADEATLFIRKASILSEEHKYQEALDLLKKVEAQGPPFTVHFFMTKANIYLQLQSPDLAIPIYRKLISQEGHKREWWKKSAYERLIDIYHDKKDYAECLKLSLGLLKEQPDDEYTVEKVALYHNYTGNSAEAEKVLTNFIQYHPKSSVCLERLGHVYFAKKDYRKAAENFDKAFKVNREENYGALKHKADSLMELQLYYDAAIDYEQCLLFFKLAPDYHVGAAKAYEKMEMMPQAIYHYRKALALDPDCKEAIDFLLELNKKKVSG